MTVILLVNPACRAVRRRPALPDEARQALTGPYADATVVASESLEDVTAVAAGAAVDDVLVVLGGDGTLRAAATGVARSGAVLAPLPGGSGNDLCRHLRISLDPLRAAAALPSWTEQRMDLGDVDGQPFLTIATLGFTAAINEQANRVHRRGPFIYVAAAVALLPLVRPTAITHVADGTRTTLDAWMVCVASTSSQGGGIQVAPGAVADDGLLDVVCHDARTWWRFVVGLVATLLRRPLRDRSVQHQRVASLRLETPRPMPVYADGERVGTTPCTIRVLPRAVRLLVPRR
ncbi:hypothetical protein GGG17_12590 [Arsenicicoccus sp. MKL-02]|uniref:DAGKc domain-containing protein n=1 Tax=Arsenicicoccus cauae TaxID=2663847 RepID=A0A6I3I9D4_9MICO|nr:diacylglycerol kinase family protein [Arsenicicoccus cauae]MTB72784.1 hypothetical protein [Arsenicicoccus cauae]